MVVFNGVLVISWVSDSINVINECLYLSIQAASIQTDIKLLDHVKKWFQAINESFINLSSMIVILKLRNQLSNVY